MEKTKSGKYINKKVKNTKSVSERLANIRLTNKESFEKIPTICPTKNNAGNRVEEYPKLRKPKPATLLKIQKHQKKTDDNSNAVKKGTQNGKNTPVSLRQEFLNKKQPATSLTKLSDQCSTTKNQGYASENVFRADFVESQQQPITLPTKHNLQLNLQSQLFNDPPTYSTKSLNYCDQHLVNVFHIKIKAHPNGFFADDLPLWYKKTFNKDLQLDWLDVLHASKKFDVENVQNKIVVYAKEVREYKHIDLNAGDKNNNYSSMELNEEKTKLEGKELEPGVNNFVRYKHLQKSLQEYYKDAGRDVK